jgi:hypothetical protein
MIEMPGPSIRRSLSLVVFVLLGVGALVGALWAGLTDVVVDGNRCGTAVATRDPAQSYVPPPNAIDDLDFLQQDLRARCGQAVLLRRTYVGIAIGALVVATVGVRRRRPERNEFG